MLDANVLPLSSCLKLFYFQIRECMHVTHLDDVFHFWMKALLFVQCHQFNLMCMAPFHKLPCMFGI